MLDVVWEDRQFMNMKHQARAVAARTAFATGYFERRLKRVSDRCVVIMYHAVADEGGLEPSILPDHRERAAEIFEAEMEYVSRVMRPIPLMELVERLTRRLPLPPNAVVVTFDDGYEDNYSIAFPILRKLKIPATIFLATGHIDSGLPFWWDELEARVERTTQPTLDVRGLGAPADWSSALPLGAERKHTLRRVARWLRNLHPEEMKTRLARLTCRLEGDGPLSTPKLLTWDRVREMHGHGIEFGAHTVTHPNLRLLDPSEAEDEIQSSIERIQDVTNSRVRSFAYPYGLAENFSHELKCAVARSHIEGVCTAVPGVPSSATDPFAIPRVSWSSGSVSLSAWKLNKYIE